jgi:hypothetical protein
MILDLVRAQSYHGILNAGDPSVRHLTIRNIPTEVAEALEKEKRGAGSSLNQTCIDLLRRALGVPGPLARSNGLATLAGTWTQAELDQFDSAIALTEQIDEELWR